MKIIKIFVLGLIIMVAVAGFSFATGVMFANQKNMFMDCADFKECGSQYYR